MSYVKNEKIKNCPICNSKPKRSRKHRSWVHCSNSECILNNKIEERHLSYHYTKWNNTFIDESKSCWKKYYLSAVDDINKLTEEVKEYSEASESWYEAYVEATKEIDELKDETKALKEANEYLVTDYRKITVDRNDYVDKYLKLERELEKEKTNRSLFQKLFG